MVTLSQRMQTALAQGKPQRFLLEFPDNNGRWGKNYVISFSNEDIVVDRGVRVDWTFNSDQELTIGSCPSAEIQFTLMNYTHLLDTFKFGECKAYIGVRIPGVTTGYTGKFKRFIDDGKSSSPDGYLYEFVDIGTFIVQRPDIVDTDMIEISANDRMTLFDKEMPGPSTIGISAGTVTIKSLLLAMCSYAGVAMEEGSGNFLNNDLTFTVPAGPKWPKEFDNKTMRDVLKWIAEAAGSIARFNRAGRLEITWFNPVDVTYDEHSYKEFSQAWYTAGAITGLKVRNAEESAESSYGSSDNPYIIAGNPFLR